MKNPNAVLVLAIAALTSSNAWAQSGTLRPLNPAVASQISGGPAPASAVAAPIPQRAPAVAVASPAPRQPLRPMQAVAPASTAATFASQPPAPLQPLPSSQPVKPLYVEAMPTAVGIAASPVVATSFLPSGARLSVALERYVRERGWDIRWQIDEDYVLDANLPIPTNDLIEAVTWVVHTYQSQGGMLGVVPRFARSNQVVVIEKMDVRDTY